MTISVIIPVYNEQRTIRSIIEVVKTWGKAHEIIVVNDGSSDATVRAISQFKKDIILLNEKINHGKGYALQKGIAKATGDILIFLDGDMLGLTGIDLDALIRPMTNGVADMVVGKLWTKGKQQGQLLKLLSGERVLRRSDAVILMQDMKTVGYGVELLMNQYFQKKRTVYVDLPFVSLFLKFEKQPVNEAMRSYIKEARELVTEVIRQQTGDFSPQARQIIGVMQRYLKQALEYLNNG